MTELEERNDEVWSIVENMTEPQVKRHGADIDEAARMSLVYFEHHPNSNVSSRSVFSVVFVPCTLNALTRQHLIHATK